MKPIVKHSQRLRCTIQAYSSAYTFTTYFIKKKIVKFAKRMPYNGTVKSKPTKNDLQMQK